MAFIPGQDKLSARQKKQFDLLTDDAAKRDFIDKASKQQTATNNGIATVAGIGASVAGAIDTDPSIGAADYAKNALTMAGTGATVGGPIGAGIGAALGIGMTAFQQNQQSALEKEKNAAQGLAIGQQRASAQGLVDGGTVQLPIPVKIKESGVYDPYSFQKEVQLSQLRFPVPSLPVEAGKQAVNNQALVDGGVILNPNVPKGKQAVNRQGLAIGGPVDGPGTATSDDVQVKLNPGDFVVPASNAKIAEQLRQMYFGQSDEVNHGDKKGTAPVALSNGEHVFTKDEAAVLKQNGINLEMLAPNAEKTGYGYYKGGKISGKDVQYLAPGGTVREKWSSKIEELYKNVNVRAYLNAIMHGETDPNNASGGKNPLSSATGYFQFLKGTNKAIKDKYGYEGQSSDIEESAKAAIALIIDNGAADSIAAGDFDTADQKLKTIWTSLPGGSEANSKTDSIPQIRKEYLENKGEIKSVSGAKSYIPYEEKSQQSSEKEKRTLDSGGMPRGMKTQGIQGQSYTKNQGGGQENVLVQAASKGNTDSPKYKAGDLHASKKRIDELEKKLADQNVKPNIDWKNYTILDEFDPLGLTTEKAKTDRKELRKELERFKEINSILNPKKPESNTKKEYSAEQSATLENLRKQVAELHESDGIDIDWEKGEIINPFARSKKDNPKLEKLYADYEAFKKQNPNAKLSPETGKVTGLSNVPDSGVRWTKAEDKGFNKKIDKPFEKDPMLNVVGAGIDANKKDMDALLEKGATERREAQQALPVPEKAFSGIQGLIDHQSKPEKKISQTMSNNKMFGDHPSDHSYEDPEVSLFSKLGEYGGLFALGQTAMGLAGLASSKDPGTYPGDPNLSTQLASAQIDATRIDPAIRANAETNLELTRRTRNAEASRMSAGDVGLAMGATRESAIDKNRGIMGLAALEEQTRQTKNARVDQRIDALSADKGKVWDSKNQRFIMNQEASAGLLNTGITNFIGAQNYSKYMRDLGAASNQNQGLLTAIGQGFKDLSTQYEKKPTN